MALKQKDFPEKKASGEASAGTKSVGASDKKQGSKSGSRRGDDAKSDAESDDSDFSAEPDEEDEEVRGWSRNSFGSYYNRLRCAVTDSSIGTGWQHGMED